MKTSEFTDEMDELFFWIDETENILGSTLKLDPQYLSDLLEKVKVSRTVCVSVRADLLTDSLNDCCCCCCCIVVVGGGGVCVCVCVCLSLSFSLCLCLSFSVSLSPPPSLSLSHTLPRAPRVLLSQLMVVSGPAGRHPLQTAEPGRHQRQRRQDGSERKPVA